MNIKEKLTEVRNEVADWWLDYGHIVVGFTSVGLVAGCVGMLYGLSYGVKQGRSEWDFSNQLYDGSECSLLVNDDMEPVAVLPMTIIKEVLDAHKRSKCQ